MGAFNMSGKQTFMTCARVVEAVLKESLKIKIMSLYVWLGFDVQSWSGVYESGLNHAQPKINARGELLTSKVP
jgi:hypothetical protein